VGGLVVGRLRREKTVKKALAIRARDGGGTGTGTQQSAVHNIHVLRRRRRLSIFTLP